MFCCLHTLTEFDPYRTYAVRDIVKGNDYIDMFQLCRSCQRFSWVSSNPIWWPRLGRIEPTAKRSHSIWSRLWQIEEQSSLAKDHMPSAYSHWLAPNITKLGQIVMILGVLRCWQRFCSDSVLMVISYNSVPRVRSLLRLLGRCREVEHAFSSSHEQARPWTSRWRHTPKARCGLCWFSLVLVSHILEGFIDRARYFTGPLDPRGSRPDLILSLVKFNHLQVSRYTLWHDISEHDFSRAHTFSGRGRKEILGEVLGYIEEIRENQCICLEKGRVTALPCVCVTPE